MHAQCPHWPRTLHRPRPPAIAGACDFFVEDNLFEEAELCFRNLLNTPEFSAYAQNGLNVLAQRYVQRAELSLGKAEQDLAAVTNTLTLSKTAVAVAGRYVAKLDSLQPENEQNAALRSRLAKLAQQIKMASGQGGAAPAQQAGQTAIAALRARQEQTEAMLLNAQNELQLRDAEISRLQQVEANLSVLLGKAQQEIALRDAEIVRLQQQQQTQTPPAVAKAVPAESAAAKSARLTVAAKPSGASVRIMNIGPRYEPGIALSPGRYDISVSANGYETHRKWYEIGNGSQTLEISLKRKAKKKASVAKSTAKPVTTAPPPNKGVVGFPAKKPQSKSAFAKPQGSGSTNTPSTLKPALKPGAISPPPPGKAATGRTTPVPANKAQTAFAKPKPKPNPNNQKRQALTAEISQLQAELKRLEAVQSKNNSLEGCVASKICMEAQQEANRVSARIKTLNQQLKNLEIIDIS